MVEVESKVSGLAFAAVSDCKKKRVKILLQMKQVTILITIIRFLGSGQDCFPLRLPSIFGDRRRETRFTGLPTRKNFPSQDKVLPRSPFFLNYSMRDPKKPFISPHGRN